MTTGLLTAYSTFALSVILLYLAILQVAAIRKKIDEERKLLAERKDLEEEERNRVKSDLDRHEREVKKAL